MRNNQFYTYKFKSSRLKEFNYDINLTFDEALEYGEVISLFDNQMLKSIRRIKQRKVDFDKINTLNIKKRKLKSLPHSKENATEIKSIQDEINKALFIPEYITIVMNHPSHYKYLFENKLKLNGKYFKRFSCSAGQARNSTVVFVEEETAKELDIIINNGRDLNHKLAPSKLNAYRGLAGSAISVVSTPRFCLVPDYESTTTFDANFVKETDYNSDDNISVETITELFNRFDGQGLITYNMAKKWADELELDYVPSQWCIRSSYIKGMVNVFDIHEFCKKENKGNYIIKTSYKDENGDHKEVDLRNIDVILSESQFKLWDSFESIESYQENCKNNGIYWGVSLYSPKKDKDILKMNYQFLQTLNLKNSDIESVCEKFVDWICGVTSENVYYTILFLLGENIDEDFIDSYLDKGENYWIKSLILNPNLINDKYIKKKVYDLIKRKIKHGCLGEILVDGNFQTIVSDPFAMMQHVCGMEVTGLLKKNEYFSNYWNQKGIQIVDSMRAPLTFRSEHVILNLRNDDVVNFWYKHSYSGIIVNIHGNETVRWAGSDFDFDILATTSNETIINSVYTDELPVVYKAPKPERHIVNEQMLYESDLFSFGSIIGSITNKSTTGYALLPMFKEGGNEYTTLMNRIKMCTKLQSAQIDKAKIGREVKGIPSIWLNWLKTSDDDSNDVKKKKEFINSILLNRHPYFFIYLYKDTKNKYKKYVKGYDITCKQKFGIGLNDLINKKRRKRDENDFLKLYEKYLPVIDSDCVMNNLCKYIESIDFNIRHNLHIKDSDDTYKNFIQEDIPFDNEKYKKAAKVYKQYKKTINQLSALNSKPDRSDFDEELYREVIGKHEKFKREMNSICSNTEELLVYLVHLFYVENPNSSKEALWSMYGKYMYENVRNKVDHFYIPVKTEDDGDFIYLNNYYKLERMTL